MDTDSYHPSLETDNVYKTLVAKNTSNTCKKNKKWLD